MALANFLDKAALGASQVLNNFDRSNFEKILNSHVIEITFDKKTSNNFEGQVMLDLLIRLLARLYPYLNINCLDDKTNSLVEELQILAKSINPLIEISDLKPSTARIVVAKTAPTKKVIPTFFIGSDGWTAFFSQSKPVILGKSRLPFGAGASACFAAANIFRTVFKDQLPYGKVDKDFSISLFTYVKDASKGVPLTINDININATLIGLGAIGNGCLWALKNIPTISGELCIVDNEQISISNLQRYVMATQGDVGKNKVDLPSEILSNNIKCRAEKKKWQEFISAQNGNATIETLGVCVDSGADRIKTQGSLPKKIINAWTQEGGLGISRHFDFKNSACLACLYLPEYKTKSTSVLLAESLGMPEHEQLIRNYLANNIPLDDNLINLISTSRSIAIEKLQPYTGKPLDVFKSEFICGGTMMNLSPESNQDKTMEVPSAFESALAGILLAAELVVDAANVNRCLESNIARFNLMRPLTAYIQDHSAKHASGRCICQDPIYQKVYEDKWRSEVDIKRKPANKSSKRLLGETFSQR
jgi:molybdopterin/thiamine biosynthesis adenylyltransferase